MAGRVTVIDVARAAGVSKSTVSLVINGSTQVGAKTQARVNEAMRELGYVYDRRAASLRQKRITAAGVIVHDLTNRVFAEIMVGIDSVLQSAGFIQLLAHTDESEERQSQVIAGIREYGIAGLIIAPTRRTTPAHLRELEEIGIPVIMVGRRVPGVKLSSVTSDNEAGAQAAVRHLVGRGYRRIGFLGGFSGTSTFEERLDGYRQAMAVAGITPEDDWIIDSAPSRRGGRDAMQRALRLTPRLEAAICINDTVAFGVYDALRSEQLTPGTDFALVGFDDLEDSRTCVPSLTTVSIDAQELGRRAAELMLSQANGGKVEVEDIVMPVTLVERESSPPRAL